MVIDDYTPVLKLIERSFKGHSVNFTMIDNPLLAMDKLEEDSFDLVILDIMMPELTGIEICKKIRNKYSLYELPVLFITAKNSISDIVEALNAGGNDYLSKPFNSNELLARANNLIKLKKLTESNSILQNAIKLKDNFVSMNIHDLKNPLTAIQLNTEIMKLSNDTKEIEKSLATIQESTKVMQNLINEILDISQIESGHYVLDKISFPVISIINEVIYRNSAYAAKKHQRLIFENKLNNDVLIFVDKDKIIQAIDNLVNNAIKYSPLHSDILVKCNYFNNSKIIIEIIDNGPGFSEDDKKKVFSKFQKLSAKPTGGENSTGLGLSIAKDIIDMHNGNIKLISEPDKGSTFKIELKI